MKMWGGPFGDVCEGMEVREGEHFDEGPEGGRGGLEIEGNLMGRISWGLVIKVPEDGDLASIVCSHGF